MCDKGKFTKQKNMLTFYDSNYVKQKCFVWPLVITLDRFLVIIFPFRVRRLEMARTRRLMAFGWTLAALLSALPLTQIQYFQ